MQWKQRMHEYPFVYGVCIAYVLYTYIHLYSIWSFLSFSFNPSNSFFFVRVESLFLISLCHFILYGLLFLYHRFTRYYTNYHITLNVSLNDSILGMSMYDIRSPNVYVCECVSFFIFLLFYFSVVESPVCVIHSNIFDLATEQP